uniref:Uncharacterized protein n=1 Tax=Ditylenchus dipsaci TaxID=166011 RepID=A0A915EL30_9BILA
MTEIAAQRDSTGILYEPYHSDFKQCVYEEGEVQGHNERYEFRCDSNLDCCGRVCGECPDTGIPLWLIPLFLILGLLLLLALLSLLAYLCCRKKKRKQEVKKVAVYRPDLYHGSTGGYRSIKHADDDDSFYRRGNRRDSYDDLANGAGNGGHGYANTAFAQRQNYPPPRPPSFHEEETFEESFKEEIEYERSNRPHSLSSSRESIIERKLP